MLYNRIVFLLHDFPEVTFSRSSKCIIIFKISYKFIFFPPFVILFFFYFERRYFPFTFLNKLELIDLGVHKFRGPDRPDDQILYGDA